MLQLKQTEELAVHNHCYCYFVLSSLVSLCAADISVNFEEYMSTSEKNCCTWIQPKRRNNVSSHKIMHDIDLCFIGAETCKIQNIYQSLNVSSSAHALIICKYIMNVQWILLTSLYSKTTFHKFDHLSLICATTNTELQFCPSWVVGTNFLVKVQGNLICPAIFYIYIYIWGRSKASSTSVNGHLIPNSSSYFTPYNFIGLEVTEYYCGRGTSWSLSIYFWPEKTVITSLKDAVHWVTSKIFIVYTREINTKR